MSRNSDLLDTTALDCGCAFTLNLDIIENNITEEYIKLCKTHYKSKNHKQTFKLNKHTNVYEHNAIKSKNQKKNKLQYSSNFYDGKILNFGKYKHKSFDYVYNKDKTYCYNLTFWKNQTPTSNNNLNEFVSFVKNAIPIY